MNEVKKLIFGLVMVCFFIQLVSSAYDTEITVKTVPYHELQLAMFDDSFGYQNLASFRGTSDEYGDFYYLYPSNETKFKISVFVKNGSKTIVQKQFNEYFIAEEPVYLEVVPSGFEIIETPGVNETEEVEEEIITTDQNVNEAAMITGSAIDIEGVKLFSGKTISWGLTILVMLGGFIFVMKLRQKRLFKQKNINITKLSDMKKEKKEKITDFKDIIEDAEKKIKEAQEEIRKLKNDDKIKAAKQKLIDDQKELMRLRSGKED